MSADDVVWRPDESWLQESNTARFLDWLSEHRDVPRDYLGAWRWSTTETGAFWDAVWEYEDVLGERGDGPALAQDRMPGAVWFPGARVNYAEHLLRRASSSRPALIAIDEDGPPTEVSWAQLAAQAGALARTLRGMGVGPGDRVVAYANNVPEAVIGLIATASIGAIWSVCSPDFGTAGVVARFRQLRPKVLLCVDGYRFNAKVQDRTAEVREIVAALPELEHVIWIPNLGVDAELAVAATTWARATAQPAELEFTRVAFEHPLWVLYSSGTTGTPKGIVHSHGGILLEKLKTARIGLEIGPQDTLMLLASTSWMVWNSMCSSLLRGTTIVLLDGNPIGADLRRIWRTIEHVGVTVLGTGAAALHATIKAGVAPAAEFDLSTLKEVMSTGSPLSPEAYRWVPSALGDRVWLNSCSGGTDICSIFVGGCPLLPVRAGRIQAPALGAAVAAWDDQGRAVVGRTGELVVTRPMPSMPVFFWDDEDGSRYHDSYFATYPGVWRHGDFIEFADDGSSVIHGRSDSTLNRNGIRMGSAEIYAIVERLPEVSEALVLGVERGEDYYMPLFIALSPGAGPDAARAAVVAAIRANLSPRHVPDEVIVVPGIPHTKTGKKLEVPLKRLFQGRALADVLDPSSVDVPELLEVFAGLARDNLSETPTEAGLVAQH